MLIEVFGDFSCPWCFIGRRRLARALELRPDVPVEIVWQPFRLNPEIPVQGIDHHLFMRMKVGDRKRIRAIEAVLEESGGKEGINFAFDRIRRTPNTMAAHRLMRYAAAFGRENVLADRIFSVYFEAGGDIGDIETLTECATAVGLDAEPARGFLRADAEYDAVAAIDQLGRQSGISGVPYFIFDRRYALAGAQEPASFLPLFDAAMVNGGEMLVSTA